MHKFWQNSLTRKMIVTLACAMSVFWLLSETISFYYRYIKAEAEVREDLSWELRGVAEDDNRRYDLAQTRVNTLLRLWRELPRSPDISIAASVTLANTVFLPLEGADANNGSNHFAEQLVEALGNSDPINSIYTFLFIPGRGYFVYSPNDPTAVDINGKLQADMLKSYRSTTSGNNWSAVFKGVDGYLRSAVTAIDPASGVMAGQLLRIDDENLRKYDFSYSLRVASGGQLWGHAGNANAPHTMQEALPECATGAGRISGYYVDCVELKGPPWQLSGFARDDLVMKRILPLLGSTAPWTLLAQLLLLLVISLILHRRVGLPLRKIVEIIHLQKQATELSYRLPEGRKDELGSIARAYNALLETINAYHQTLEDKVRVRTCELDVAKRVAEQANDRKSEHLTSISHEIRTPLNGIVGALSLLERGTLSDQQHELVSTARQSSGFLLSIINNLLDFSRIEAGQMELSYEQTKILAMLDQVMLTINLRAQEKRLELQTLVAADVPWSISLDGLRVQQILVNLLANAVKFTQHGGVYVEVERRSEMLAMAVRDTGSGISQENQIDIFKPFTQVRAHDNGSGLGLAIAARLANLMGGDISLESHLGLGSTFTLLLPIRDPKLPPSRFSGRLVAPLTLQPQLTLWGVDVRIGNSELLDMVELQYLPGRLWHKVSAITLKENSSVEEPVSIAPSPWVLKVLIVDDISVNREIVGKMIRELGHQAHVSGSGQEALQQGRRYVFDLVLMDMRMPQMDGLQTTTLWRDPLSDMLDPNTPIIALTANALSAERDRAKAAGMNGYLFKPVSLEQLAAALEQAAMLQLERGIELAPNQGLQQPLFNLADTALRNQLNEALETIHKKIIVSVYDHDRELLLELLHSLKGCAGQGGYDLVYEMAQEQEIQIHQGCWPSDKDVSDLGELIQQTM